MSAPDSRPRTARVPDPTGADGDLPLAQSGIPDTMDSRALAPTLTATNAPTPPATPAAPVYRVRAILLVAMVVALGVLAWSDPVHQAVLQVFEVSKSLI